MLHFEFIAFKNVFLVRIRFARATSQQCTERASFCYLCWKTLLLAASLSVRLNEKVSNRLNLSFNASLLPLLIHFHRKHLVFWNVEQFFMVFFSKSQWQYVWKHSVTWHLFKCNTKIGHQAHRPMWIWFHLTASVWNHHRRIIVDFVSIQSRTSIRYSHIFSITSKFALFSTRQSSLWRNFSSLWFYRR